MKTNVFVISSPYFLFFSYCHRQAIEADEIESASEAVNGVVKRLKDHLSFPQATCESTGIAPGTFKGPLYSLWSSVLPSLITFSAGMDTFEPQHWTPALALHSSLSLQTALLTQWCWFTWVLHLMWVAHCLRTDSLQSNRKRAKAAVRVEIAQLMECFQFCNKSGSYFLCIWAEFGRRKYVTRRWYT